MERNTEIRNARYASFLSRFGALLIDDLVTAPVLLLPFLARSWPTMLAVLAVLLRAAAIPAYNIFCHGRYGQTVGKRVFGIRVHLVSGAAITWRAAWIRHSPDVVIAALWAFGVAHVIAARDPASLAELTYPAWERTIRAERLAFVRWTDIGAQIWVWSEVVIMLLNKQRRALHDLIAGTVVLQVGRDD